MADLKQLKMKPRDDFGSDDPLAELTRIMGLSPQTAPADEGFDDFGIDLERELLGELGRDDSFVPPEPANMSLPVTPVHGRAGAAMQAGSGWQAPAAHGETSFASAQEQPAMPFRVIAPEPAVGDQWQDGDDAEALERELGAYLEEHDVFSAPPAAEDLSFETAELAEPDARFAPDEQPATGFEAMAPATAVMPTSESAAAQAPESVEPVEEDPFDRLAAMSREWQQRRRAREAGLMPEAVAPSPVVARPQPVSVPSQERMPAGSDRAGADAASQLRVAVAPVADARPATEGAAPHTPIRFVPVDEVATAPAPEADTAPLRAEPAPAAELQPQPVLRQAQPQPVTAAQAVPAGPDGIFDPFAELAAMAEQSRSRASAYVAPTPATASEPEHARALEQGPEENSASAAGHSAPAAAAPANAGVRRDAASPAVVQPRPRTTPTSFQPSAERSSSWRRVDTVAPSAAPVAAALAAETTREEAAAFLPEPQAPVAEAPVDTWDAISAWAGQPAPAVTETGVAEAEPEAHVGFATPVADASVIRGEAQIPGDHAVTTDDGVRTSRHESGAPAAQFADEGDFDLDSLLEAELAEEAITPSWTSQTSFAAASSAQPLEDARAWQTAPAAEAFADGRSEDASQVDPAGADYGPEVDTIEVPLAHYEVADDLDLPELVFEDETPPSAPADELDLEFANAFEELAVGRSAERTQPAQAAAPTRGWSQAAHAPQTQPEGRAPVSDVDDLESAFDEAVRSWAQTEGHPGAHAPAGYHPSAYAADEQLTGAEWSDDLYEDRRNDEAGLASAFYPGSGEAVAPKAPPRRRGLMVAALVAGVAAIGGIGAFALSLGDAGNGGAPVLVKADPDPVKVKPEQPGGVTIPNQDKAVYERVAAGEGTQPSQERLVSSREEPVDLAVRTAPLQEAPQADAARVKSEERVDPVDELVAAPADDVPAIAPRRVRTMVVRPDGTLVPREEPAAQPVPETAPLRVAAAPEAVALSPADADAAEIRAASQAAVAEAAAEAETAQAAAPEAPSEPAATTEPAVSDAAPAATSPDAAPAVAATAPVRVVESQTITREAAPRQSTPDRGPVAPSRPADQPVDIVNRAPAAQTQVAAVAPAPAAAAPTSEWSMQIASQPSPEGAQASYADLSRRYGSILGGRGVNIVKADIAGKGTFWRVRIPAASRAEANALCETYKAAGGSCFVSK